MKLMIAYSENLSKISAPKMDHSSHLTPVFEGKMNKEDTKNEAHARTNVR